MLQRTVMAVKTIAIMMAIWHPLWWWATRWTWQMEEWTMFVK